MTFFKSLLKATLCEHNFDLKGSYVKPRDVGNMKPVDQGSTFHLKFQLLLVFNSDTIGYEYYMHFFFFIGHLFRSLFVL